MTFLRTRFLLPLALVAVCSGFGVAVMAQAQSPPSVIHAESDGAVLVRADAAGAEMASSSLDAPEPAADSGGQSATQPAPGQVGETPHGHAATADTAAANAANPKQPKRILFIIPNFRAVSADTKLPPMSAKDKFSGMFQDSFDYSAFVYVGMLAGAGQIQDSYPQFHQGAAGYGRYYWHSFADNLNGNMFTEFIMPVATHEDPRYYTLGHGGIIKRSGYAFSRLLITRTDGGDPTLNVSEIVGNGAAAGLSGLYYPQQYRTWTKTGQRWITQIGLDGVTQVFREFVPDIGQKVFHQSQ